MEPRPQYVKETSPYHRRTALWALTSSFGVVPHPTDHKGGVLVKDVLEETAAARAGIKAGDRIVALGGQAAEDLQTYLRIVRALPPGERVDVFLVRGDRPQKIVVELAKLNFAQTAAAFGIVPDPAAKDGLRLQRVTANSTAERAGLKPGDRIVEIAGKPATSLEAMRQLLGLNPGDRVELTYERQGKVQKLTVTLAFDPTGALGASTIAARPAPTKPGAPMRQVGVSVARTESGEGARVTRVAEGSTAATGGLKVDDIITAVADKPVKSAEDYLKALGGHKDGDSVEFTVKREGKPVKLKLTLRLVESRLAP
jgi:S1-C subfamily serine protease